MQDYYMPIMDDDGAIIGSRPATRDEVKQINPQAAAILEMQEMVDQLVLDSLLG